MCSRRALFLVLIAVGAVVAGCGKQGNPLPPLTFNPAPTQDLRVRQLGEQVELRLTYPVTTTSGLGLTGIEIVEVYRVQMPISSQPMSFGADLDPETDLDPEAESATPGEHQPPEGEESVESTEQLPSEETVPEEQESQPTEDATASTDAPPEREPIRPALFSQLAGIEAVIEEAELLAATSGNQIALRLPLAQVPEDEPTLFAYAVRTIGLNGLRSPYSNIAELEPLDAPVPPSEIVLEAQKDGVQISWSSTTAGISGFAVYRRQGDVRVYGDALARLGTDVESYLDTAALYDTSYFYTVRALSEANATVESGIGGEGQIDYRDRFPPPAPVNVEVLPESGQIRLLWDASEDSDVAGYLVYRQDPGGEYGRLVEDPLTRQEYLDRGLSPGLTYRYQVTAIDQDSNESEHSAEVTGEPGGR